MVSISLARANRVGFWRRDTKNVCYYPPPPTESGRLLEITENFCYYPPPPPVSCCAPPRLPAPDPPLQVLIININGSWIMLIQSASAVILYTSWLPGFARDPLPVPLSSSLSPLSYSSLPSLPPSDCLASPRITAFPRYFFKLYASLL